ncbi:hypothetical protein [Reinekea sp. G2M2-21]|uniref:hypothetical protein n=1 Tax=Reinekea sp. G2M2-21 TaxID=2788942 RepID=UPI0018ABBA31|nr:hypothetical protein [Reinekea sp. G2M2-21]
MLTFEDRLSMITSIDEIEVQRLQALAEATHLRNQAKQPGIKLEDKIALHRKAVKASKVEHELLINQFIVEDALESGATGKAIIAFVKNDHNYLSRTAA